MGRLLGRGWGLHRALGGRRRGLGGRLQNFEGVSLAYLVLVESICQQQY